MSITPAVWFPTVRTNTGTDIFTERLVKDLQARDIRAEITWLPLRAEYAPWSVPTPQPPEWATAVHVNTWLHPRFIPKHLPVVATIHHAIHHPDALSYKGCLRAAYHKYWIASIERRVMRRANRVIAVSQFVADSANETLVGVPMQVIYNGINTNIFKPGSRVRQPNEPFRLLFVGSWMARKGIDLLPLIMRELGDGFELYYTGGPAAERDKVNMLPNMKNIRRLDGDVAVATAMQNADALLFPSRSEGHPLVAIEAMACELVVIAMKGSSITEVVKHNVNGYLCERNNINNFVDTIRLLEKNKKLQHKTSSQARIDAIRIFSSETVTKKYIVCYESLSN